MPLRTRFLAVVLAVLAATIVTDVVNVLLWEELDDVVLVGHSYGGMVITGVAEVVPERIRRLVYFDAFLPMDGPKSILAGVREAAASLAETDGGPKALLLISQEFDGGEDDVEGGAPQGSQMIWISTSPSSSAFWVSRWLPGMFARSRR